MGTVLQEFQWAIQALAAPADDQLARFPDFVVKADELGLDFDQWMQVAVERHGPDWSPGQRESIEALDRMLSSMSGSANSHLWQEEDLRIPQFAELAESDERRVRQLIREFRWIMATAELRSATGCPTHWAQLWVEHADRPKPDWDKPAPCPYCGMPLRTQLAKQCRHCRRDWHDPQRLRWLGDESAPS